MVSHLTPKARVRPHFTRLDQRTYQIDNERKRLRLTFHYHDPVWKEVNEELKVALPQAFPHSRLRSRKINDFSSRLDLWLHKFCKQRFGLKPPPKNLSPSSKPPKQNKQLEELRKKKKTCRAAYKALVKDGLQGSEEAVYILSKWKLLLRRHNRLRLNLIQVRQLRASKKAAACFRKDPNKFAENIQSPWKFWGPRLLCRRS